jgi:uncharacterized protein
MRTLSRRDLCLGMAAMAAAPAARAQGAPLQFYSAGQGSAFLPYAEAVARFVAGAGAPAVQARVSSGSLENLRAVNESPANIGAVFLGSALDAMNGSGPFAAGRLGNLRALFAMYETSFQIAAPRASGARGLRDLGGKRVGVGPAGGPAEVFFRGAAQVAGVSAVIVNGAPADQTRQLLAGELDALWQGAIVPIPALTAAANAADMVIIGLTPDEVRGMLAGFPALASANIPAGSYRGQTAPVESVAAWNFVLAHRDMPDATAEALVRAVFSATSPATQIHATAASSTARNADKNRIVPFHPGAIAAHRAHGVTPPMI